MLLLWAVGVSGATQTDGASELLKKADDIRTYNHREFVSILESVEKERDSLTPDQNEYLRFLEGWRSAYEGDRETSLARLTSLVDDSKNPTLRLRAGATAVNVLSYEKRYEEAYSRLETVLALLPQVSDGQAREQAMLNAADLYTGVGQYDLSLRYAQLVIDANWAGHGYCKGWQQKLESLYDSGRIDNIAEETHSAVDNCVKVGEVLYADAIRIRAAQFYIHQDEPDDAIELLKQRYDEFKASQEPWLIAKCDATLADAYRRTGQATLAQQFALNVIGSPVHADYVEPLATAYGVLYELAKQRDDFKSALGFYELFSAADRARLADLSSRHLAFQLVNHENIANKLQLDALNKENHVLQLQRELSGKAMETSRLYIALLTMTVVFIGLWAYRTKRSQLHFQSLSQLDGLTGICNRPHFIAQAEKVLETSRRSGEHHCIVLFDLDHFKSINDRYGHATGDFVLKRTVSACKVHLERGDIFGRFGGEEFAILLPSCGAEEGRERAERLRVTIASITAYQGTTKATVSASFGIATTSASGHGLGQLLAHADTALYAAKRSGRNRVVVHGDQTSDISPLSVLTTTGEFPSPQVSGRTSTG